MGISDLDEDALHRLYGPWRPRRPGDVVALLEGYAGLWWIAGGWAIEAFTGRSREHADIDPCVLAADLPLLRRHLAGRLDVWAAFDGALRPLLPDDDGPLPAGTHQVWLRPSGAQPWEHDVLLSAGTPDTWAYRRDPTITLPMSEALWEHDGIRYLRPEVQLLHKARAVRPKDQLDLESTLPLIDPAARAWLHHALRRTEPGHPWLSRL